MQENVEKAFEAYRLVLKKNKLEECKDYDVNFEIPFFSQKVKISKVRFKVFVDKSELSPILIVDCLGEDVYCCISFAKPEFVLDKYDKTSIYTNNTNFASPHTYDLSLFKTFLKTFNIITKKEKLD